MSELKKEDVIGHKQGGLTIIGLRPTEDYVFVEDITAEQVTASGIIVPGPQGPQSSKCLTGVVVAAGPGRLTDQGQWRNVNVALHDKVLYPQHAGYDITHGSKTYKAFRESNIIAVVE
jgi:chaperonin GroES